MSAGGRGLGHRQCPTTIGQRRLGQPARRLLAAADVEQRRLLDPLALRVLEGAFREGDTIAVDVAGNELSFTKGQAVHA